MTVFEAALTAKSGGSPHHEIDHSLSMSRRIAGRESAAWLFLSKGFACIARWMGVAQQRKGFSDSLKTGRSADAATGIASIGKSEKVGDWLSEADVKQLCAHRRCVTLTIFVSP